MGRELRRVPMDFDWPHNKVWPGFVNPHYRHCPKQGTECFNGYTPGGIWLERIVDLLLLAGSDAAEVTRGIRPGRIWPHPWLTGMPLAPAVGPGSDLADLTSGLAGRPPSIMGHDALDCHAAMQAIRKAAGMPEDWGICPVCKGSDIDPEIREKYEAWEQELPPEGPGYQLWETTSEGSPISPVFSTAEALADWCAEHASVFGHMMMPREEWLQSFKSHKGIDALFSFDYMGSAEFEFGTIPRAYKIMREARTDDWKVRELKIGVTPTSTNLTAYFVGRPEDLPVAEALLRDQLQKTPKHRTKEITSIRVSYGLDEPFGYGAYDGWWAVDTGLRQAPDDTCVPFVIFRMREHAQAWLKAMEATTAASK